MTQSKNRACQGINRTSEMKKDSEGFYKVTLGRYGSGQTQTQKIWYLKEGALDRAAYEAKHKVLVGQMGRHAPASELEPIAVGCIFKDLQVEIINGLTVITAGMKPFGTLRDGLQLIIDEGRDTLVFEHRSASKDDDRKQYIEKIITWDIVKVKQQPA